jgi:hypothetical protein
MHAARYRKNEKGSRWEPFVETMAMDQLPASVFFVSGAPP